MSEVWKHIASATQQTNGLDDNHKVNGSFGPLAGLYGMDPATAYSMIPGTWDNKFVRYFLKNQNRTAVRCDTVLVKQLLPAHTR